MAGYNGAATMYGSSMVRAPQGFITARDPNWELQQASEEQTSVFVEPLATRLLTAVGKINPTRIGGVIQSKEYWGTPSGDEKTITLTFSFQDVSIQDCYGIQVESLELLGVPTTVAFKSRAAGGELCGDILDDSLSGTTYYCNFTGGGGVLQFREIKNPSVVHKIHIFDPKGYENGWYSLEDVFTAIKSKVKSFLDTHYSPNTINVEVFVNSEGRIVLAWSGAAIEAITGGLQLDYSITTSTLFSFINRFLIIAKFKRGAYTSGAVVNGDGVEFLIEPRSVNAGDTINTLIGTTNLGVAISSELTQFQRKDSITPIAASGEIATFNLGYNQFSSGYLSTAAQGTLYAPKVAFDPSYTLDSFTVSLTFAAQSELLTRFFDTMFSKQQGGGFGAIQTGWVDNLEERLTLTLTARLF